MTNGKFPKSPDDVGFGNAYNTGASFSHCMALKETGDYYKCSNTNVLCEKSLLNNASACVAASNLEQALTSVNASTEITIWRQSPQKCIEYCRGLGNTNTVDMEDNLFAIVYKLKCVCGTGPMDPTHRESLSKCSRNGYKAFEGKNYGFHVYFLTN